MKRSSVLAGALLAISFGFVVSSTAETINIKDAPAGFKRVMPSAETNVVLSFYDAVKEAKKCVVNISTHKTVKNRAQMSPFFNDPFFRDFFGQDFGQMVPKERVERSLGSGVVISENGYIVTNNHVIDGADKIMVTLPGNKKEYEAKVIGTDPKSDIAVIKISADKLSSLSFADSAKVKEGDVVFAIGNPFGIGETITHGIISAINKTGLGINNYENFIQTDASINPGNSGGALIDSRGALVGINTAIISQSGTSAGVGFAIPSDMVKSVAKQLVEKGKIERGYLGISLSDLTAQQQKFYKKEKGAVVVDVAKNTPAAKAGLKRGDLILSINGQEIENSADLKNKVGSHEPGTEITLEIDRNGKIVKQSVKLGKAGASGGDSIKAKEFIAGLSVAAISEEAKKKYGLPNSATGALVDGIKEGSKAAEAGFSEGDLIVQIEDKQIDSITDFDAAVKEYEKLTQKRVYVQRRGVVAMIVAGE